MATTAAETDSYLMKSPLTRTKRLDFSNHLKSLQTLHVFSVGGDSRVPDQKEFRTSQYAHHSIDRLMKWPTHKQLPKGKFDGKHRTLVSYTGEDSEQTTKNIPLTGLLRDGRRVPARSTD